MGDICVVSHEINTLMGEIAVTGSNSTRCFEVEFKENETRQYKVTWLTYLGCREGKIGEPVGISCPNMLGKGKGICNSSM